MLEFPFCHISCMPLSLAHLSELPTPYKKTYNYLILETFIWNFFFCITVSTLSWCGLSSFQGRDTELDRFLALNILNNIVKQKYYILWIDILPSCQSFGIFLKIKLLKNWNYLKCFSPELIFTMGFNIEKWVRIWSFLNVCSQNEILSFEVVDLWPKIYLMSWKPNNPFYHNPHFQLPP